MQFTIAFTTLLAVASAAAISERSPASVKGRAAGKLVARDGVCGTSTPLCCQLDVDGVANLNCENGMSLRHTPFLSAKAANPFEHEC